MKALISQGRKKRSVVGLNPVGKKFILNLPVYNLYFNLLYKLCCLNQLKVPGEFLCSQVSSVLLLPVQPQTQHRAGTTPAQIFNVELSKFIIQ